MSNTMRSGSNIKVPAKYMLECYRISECPSQHECELECGTVIRGANSRKDRRNRAMFSGSIMPMQLSAISYFMANPNEIRLGDHHV